MRYILAILLLVFFGYSIALVLLNSAESTVDLVFTQIPAMRLGLLLLITLGLGIAVGLLLGVQMFHVIQNKLEITRLKKEIELLKQTQMNSVAEKALQYARESDFQKQHENAPVMAEMQKLEVNQSKADDKQAP